MFRCGPGITKPISFVKLTDVCFRRVVFNIAILFLFKDHILSPNLAANNWLIDTKYFKFCINNTSLMANINYRKLRLMERLVNRRYIQRPANFMKFHYSD